MIGNGVALFGLLILLVPAIAAFKAGCRDEQDFMLWMSRMSIAEILTMKLSVSIGVSMMILGPSLSVIGR